MGPLQGLRVLELSSFLNGPYTGRILGELGADVIKVEPPWGDPMRHVPPYVGKDSLHFIFYNANKKFVTLNIKEPRGKHILFELLKKVDVLVENFKPGTLDDAGLGYEEQKRVNPKIISVSATGYGYEGPYRDYPGFDPTVQAVSGLMDTNGFPDMPTRVGMGVLDLATPAFTVIAILAALRYRDLTGEGQRIDMSMFDVAVILSQQSMVYYLGGLPVRIGPSSHIFAPESLFKTKDGFAYAIIHTQEAFQNLAEYFGESQVAEDPRFRTNDDRLRNREELLQIASGWFARLSTKEAVELVMSVGGVAGELRDLKEQLHDPHVEARHLYLDFTMPNNEKVRIPGSAFKMEKTPGVVSHPGLPVGYHNEEIYSGLLMISKNELAQLRTEGVV